MKRKDVAKKTRIKDYKKEKRKIEQLLGINNQIWDENVDENSFAADSLILAPVMNIFVLWVLANASSRGIRRLYFLSRDGYPAFIVATKYCKELNLEIECRYLYCSRYALRMPMYSYNIKEAINYICSGGIHVTWEKIFCRAGMSEIEIQSVLENLEESIDLKKELLYSELGKAKRLLLGSKEFVGLLIDKSKKEWDMLYGYFKQEGLFSNDKIAVVDSGWIGTIQKSINDIRHRSGVASDLEGFYFGLYDIPLESPSNIYHSFFFTPKKGFLNKIFFNNCFYEAVFSENSGITIRYEKEGHNYVPVLGKKNVLNEKKISQINKEIVKYTDYIINNMESSKVKELQFYKLRKVIKRMFRMLICNPTNEEANYYGTLEFSDGLLDEDKQELAILMSKKELKRNYLFVKVYSFIGLLKDSVTESAWYEGSAVRIGDSFGIYRINYSVYKIFVYIKYFFT